MAAAKLEVTLQANTQGAVENLKATQANINRVADALVKLQNSGVNVNNLNNSINGFSELINRLASAMYTSGDAASFYDAKMKVVIEALKSASEVVNGDASSIGDILRSWGDEADRAAIAMKELTDSEDDFGDSTKDTTEVVKKQGSKLLDTAKNILKFQLVMRPITSAMRTFRQTLSDSIKVAAEAEQVYSKLSTVFDGLGSATENAADLAKQIGTATSTAASALSTVGDLLQAQGMTVADSLETATEWVSQFQDIIAFKDIDMSLEEFAQNFMSGAAGNLRNFRTFGSIVKESAVNARLASQGLDKLTGSELELAKMTARAEIALEQQGNSTGATEREWDSMLSIQRRMSEETKRLEENLGSYINTGVKPLERLWASILDSINDSIEAQEKLNELKGGNGGLFLPQWLSNLWDKSFGASGSFSHDALSYATDVLGSGEQFSVDQIKSLVDIGTNIYGLSKERVTELLGDLGAVSVSAEKVSAAFDALAEDDAKRIADEAAAAEKERIKSTFSSFTEAIGSLTGVKLLNINPLDRAGLRSGGLLDASTAFAQMKANGLSSYADQLDVALGNDYTTDALKAKQEEWATLYETARNFFIKNNENHKLTESDEKLLKKIAAEYHGITADIEAYDTRKENLETQAKNLSSYQKQLSQLGMSDYEKTMDDLLTAWSAAANVEDWELADAVEANIKAFQDLTDATEAQTKAEEAQKKAEEKAAAWKSVGDSALSSLGTTGSIISTFTDGEGDFWSDLMTVLVELIQKCESWESVLEAIDSILDPIIDSLEPMLEIVDALLPVINLISLTLKPVATIVAILGTTITEAIDAVVSVFANAWIGIKDLWNAFANSWLGQWMGVGTAGSDWSDRYRWADGSFSELEDQRQQELQETVEKIWGETVDINNNTSSTDYSTYAQLLRDKYITSDQYATLIGSNKYSSSTTIGSATMTTGSASNATYITINGLTLDTDITDGKSVLEFLKDNAQGVAAYGR